MRHENGRTLRSPGAAAPLALALAILAAALAPEALAEVRVTPEEAAKTQAVRPDYRNPWCPTCPDPGPLTPDKQPGTAFFGGEFKDPAQTPSGSAYLSACSFGQPFAASIPYASTTGSADGEGGWFIADAVRRAGKLLYYDQADNVADDVDNPDQNIYAKGKAAYRYKILMYSRSADELTPRNQIQSRSKTMVYFYKPEDRTRSLKAERILRDALKYAPGDKLLRNALLDLYYDRVVAEQAFAKEKLVDLSVLRVNPPATADGQVITGEIDLLKKVLGRPATPGGTPPEGGYAYAFAGYFELLNDPLGVDVRSIDPAVTDGRPFGLYMFQKEVPDRSLYAASYLEGGVPAQVVDTGKDAGGNPLPLFRGWKDLTTLMAVFADYGEAAAQLAKLWSLRGQGTDTADALTLAGDVQGELDLNGNLLLSLFDSLPGPFNPKSPPPAADPSWAGLQESVSRWRHALTQLQGVREFIRGGANVLGLDPQMLLFINDAPAPESNPTFDTYDAMAAWMAKANTPLVAAKVDLEKAYTTYDKYMGTKDDLSTQFNDRETTYNQRLFKIVGANRDAAGYDTPFANAGSELNLQKLSIDLAANRIKKVDQQVLNIDAQIQIEADGRAKVRGIQNQMQDMVLDFGKQQAQLTRELSYWSAAQASASAVASGANSWATSLGASLIVAGENPILQAGAEIAKGELQAQKERLAAQQQSNLLEGEERIEDSRFETAIKTLLLQKSTLTIDMTEARIMLVQEMGRLVALQNEQAEIERLMDQENKLLATRYFADPVHLLRMQTSMIAADKSFIEAQKWVFLLARAWEYKWNTAFEYNGYVTGSAFRARNAGELDKVVTALDTANANHATITRTTYTDWYSIREDFFGYKYQVGGKTQYYRDPATGETVNAIEAFRRMLKSTMDPNGKVTLSFSTARERPVYFFRGPTFKADGTVDTKGTYLDKIIYMKINLPGNYALEDKYPSASGYLTYGGVSYIRNQQVGQPNPSYPTRTDMILNETTSYPTRYWYYNDTTKKWEFSDLEGYKVMVYCKKQNSSRVEPESEKITAFRARSVAATEWTLTIETRVGAEQTLDIDQLNDVELFFSHWMATRQ